MYDNDQELNIRITGEDDEEIDDSEDDGEILDDEANDAMI